jgi:hypothetical protein
MMKLFLPALFLAVSLSGCGSKSDPTPAPNPTPPAVDNAVYLRVTTTGVPQSGMKAGVQQTGTLTNAVVVPVQVGNATSSTKSVFVSGQSVRLTIFTNDLPVKGTAKIVADLVKAGVVIASSDLTWDSAAPPTFDQPSQSASVSKTLTLP